MLRIVSFKVPSGCLCDSDAENIEDRKLQDPSAYDMDHWLQTEVRRLFLNAGDIYDTHSMGKDPRMLRYPVKRQIHQGGEAMSTVRILALILSKVEPSDRLPIFQEVKGIMSEKVNYMREARKIIEAIFGGGGTADGTTDVGSSDGSTKKPDASPQPQETDDTLKVKIIQFLLRRAMAEVMCNATVVVKLDEHKTPSFLPQEFVKEMQQNEKVTLSPIACLLVSTALRCRDTDVLQAIRDGRLARMIVAAEMVSEGIAKVLDDSDGKISAVFQLAGDNTTAASLTAIDENKVAEIQGFFDRVLEATGNSGSTTDTTVWTTTTENDKQSTSGIPQQETTTLPPVTSDPIIVTPSKAPASEEPTGNPVIPPKEQLPSSEYMNFNDTGAVLSSFLNVTGDPWFLVTNRPLTETSAGGKPVTSTTSVPTQTMIESETMNISEVQTEETRKPTTLPSGLTVTAGTSDFPSTVTVEISENPMTFTGSSDTVTTDLSFSGTTTSFTDETPSSSLAVTEETVTEYPASVTEGETTASVGVSTEMTYTVPSTDVSKSQTETTTNTFASSVSESTTGSMNEETEGDDFLTSDSIAMGITTEGTVTMETGTTEAITETTTTEEFSSESVTEATVTGESTPIEIFTEETATTAINEESTPRETATEGTVTEELTSEEMVTEGTLITEDSTDSETATEGAVTQDSTDSETATEGAVTQESTDSETATEDAVTQESTDSETATEDAVTQESTDSETATEDAVTQESTDSETATEDAVTQESTDSETATEGAVTQESTPSATVTEAAVTQKSTPSETITEIVTKESTSVTEIIESTTEATPQILPHEIAEDILAPPVIPSEEDLPKTEYEPLNVPVEFILHFLS
ncbi:mucin-2-like [Penaeus indicus]|uniref:mucin-2-like n=1 Tax=Penaeus indicus TaxID=29960 RepID=UPI00300D23FE